jgi:oxygen-independent coproporphyrinogen-3 oxidase
MSGGAPFGVYVHVPWCRRRCSYCDFAFVVGRARPEFVPALAAELELRASEAPGRPADTIYFGGGTPSALDDETLREAVARIRATLPVATDAELTLEANPEDIDESRLDAWRAAGFSRLSLGVQSFDDEVLRFLGRVHDGEVARRITAAALERFERVSIDLIAGVPGQGAERLEADVRRTLELGVGHVSAYLLTVEEGTPLHKMVAKGRREDVDDDAQADDYEALQTLLPAGGLRQYEVSSWARPGHESRHNRIYWGQGTYLGLGPGAHSMALLDDGSVVRRHTEADIPRWLESPAAAAHDDETLAPEAALLEALAFGLRDLVRGASVSELEARHRARLPAEAHAALAAAAGAGFVVERDGRLRLTLVGARFADAVARDVLCAAPTGC